MKENLKKAVCCGLGAILSCAAFAACEKQKESVSLEGEYSLVSAVFGNTDYTSRFRAYSATFSADGSVRVVIDYLGALETRNSAYSCDGETVTETYKGETFTYSMSGDTLITDYSDGGDPIRVTLGKKTRENEETAVDFESILFGTSIEDTKFFNYCPAILTETVDGQEIMNIWYCSNKDDGVIMDHIAYRKGVKQSDGKWKFSEQQIVLAPTPDTWDARHTCDPAVVKGEFSYNGTKYAYLMAYLGCTTEDYQKNETGLAVANAPEGPWVKVSTLNPIVPWYDDGKEEEEQKKYESMQGTTSIYWGTGMPALVSLDKKGQVLMFYQSTLRGTGIQQWDFSDLNNPKRTFVSSISHNGIVNYSQGRKCNIGIPDFAYDPAAKRFYVCGVTGEKNPADVTKTLVSSHSFVAYIDGVENTEQLAQLMKSGGYTWKMAGYVGPDVTGSARNHNPGIVRNAYGELPDSKKMGVVVSTGRNDGANENIFTYRLHGAYVKLP